MTSGKFLALSYLIAVAETQPPYDKATLLHRKEVVESIFRMYPELEPIMELYLNGRQFP